MPDPSDGVAAGGDVEMPPSQPHDQLPTDAGTESERTNGWEPSIPTDVWRIHGRDYDLTSFVNDHPGGPHMIMMGKGTDCTILFETYHIINEPRKRLAKHDVTPDGQKPPVPERPSAFMADVRTMIREHFKDQPKGTHKSSWLRTLLIFVTWCLMVASFGYGLHFRSVPISFASGFFGYVVMVNLAHDGSHGAYSTKPKVNLIAHLIGAAPFVTGQYTWWMQHVVSHHQHTNEVGKDVDSHHFPFVRWHRNVPHEISGGRWCAGPHNMAWHILTYVASTLSMSVIHPIHFLWQPLAGKLCCGGVSENFKGGLETAITPRHYVGCCPPPKFDSAFEKVAGNFVLQGVATLTNFALLGNLFIWMVSFLCLFAPFIYWGVESPANPMDWVHATLLAFAPYAASSMSFMCITQISHIQEDTQHEAVLANADPYMKQAMTSMDYSERSYVVQFLTGGLNLQSIHHTVPVISCVHYTDLYPKFIAVCKKHNCEPAHSPTMCSALSKHLTYVFRLGRGDVMGVVDVTASEPPNKAKKGRKQRMNFARLFGDGSGDEEAATPIPSATSPMTPARPMTLPAAPASGAAPTQAV